MAIKTFADKETEHFFKLGTVCKNAGWKSSSKIAARKLDMLHYAASLIDLRSPPGNRLEKLKGHLKAMYSIRINDQWRIMFRWTDSGPMEVRIIDYHE